MSLKMPCDQIKILSANCQGLRDGAKRAGVLNYLSQKKPNIVCLQDTHLISKDQNNLRCMTKCECLVNGAKTNSRGVAILLFNNFEYKLLHHGSDNYGNLLYADINTNSLSMRIINVYAPNLDTPSFFQNINILIEENTMDHLIFCGDFNLVLNPAIDTSKYVSINNPKSRITLLETISTYNLKDAFRHFHPCTCRYTW